MPHRYPRLQLENRIYCSRVFRKLHIEIGARQDGLHVMHIILYPRYEFDIPILAFDLVVVNGVVTLAIIDAVPVTRDLSLPAHYAEVRDPPGWDEHHVIMCSYVSSYVREVVPPPTEV